MNAIHTDRHTHTHMNAIHTYMNAIHTDRQTHMHMHTHTYTHTCTHTCAIVVLTCDTIPEAVQ